MSNCRSRLRNSNNMNNNPSRNFSIPIQPFDGDPAVLDFFTNQIKEVCNINKYENNQAVAFFRAHLKGAALSYYCTEPFFKTNVTLDQILNKFKEYFRELVPTVNIHNLQTLQMLPSESVHNLAHRLNTIISQVYPEVIDELARNTIKFKHFIAALPYNIRVNLLKENISDFNEAVKRAQQLQDIEIAAAVVPMHTSNNQINHLENEIKSLKEQLNVMTQHKQEENQTNVGFRNHKDAYYKKRFSRNFNNQNFHKNTYKRPKFDKYKFNKNSYCTFCGRNNHIMKNCREFLSIIKVNDIKEETHPKHIDTRSRRNYASNKQSYSRSFPNAEAKSFSPHNLNC